MTFECLDIIACDCQAHVSWDTHVATCPSCHLPLRQRTPGGPIVTSANNSGWCVRCDQTWLLPKPHPDIERNWVWTPRAFFDYTDLLPVGERAEMAANAEPPEEHR